MPNLTSSAVAAKALRLAADFLYSEESNETEVLIHDILYYLSWYLDAETVPAQRGRLYYAKELIGELYDSICKESGDDK